MQFLILVTQLQLDSEWHIQVRIRNETWNTAKRKSLTEATQKIENKTQRIHWCNYQKIQRESKQDTGGRGKVLLLHLAVASLKTFLKPCVVGSPLSPLANLRPSMFSFPFVLRVANLGNNLGMPETLASECRTFLARKFSFKDPCGLLGRLYSGKLVQGPDFRPWTAHSLMLIYLVWKAVVDLYTKDSWLKLIVDYCWIIWLSKYKIIWFYIVFVKNDILTFFRLFLHDFRWACWAVLEPTKDQYPVGVPRGYLLSSSLKRNFSNMFSLLSAQPTKPIRPRHAVSQWSLIALIVEVQIQGAVAGRLTLLCPLCERGHLVELDVLRGAWHFLVLHSFSLIFSLPKHPNPLNPLSRYKFDGTKCIMFVIFCSCTAFSMRFEVSKMCYSDLPPAMAMSTLRGTHSASGQNAGMDSQIMCCESIL